jgi:hypothetical protein
MFRVLPGGGLGLATALGVLIAPAFAADQTPHRVIVAQDACDSTIFNQMFGPGTCVRNGGVTLQLSLQGLQRLQRAPQWRFSPDQVRAGTDDPILVKNTEGETHTFTEVAAFGGGFVPLLKQLAGTLTERPECAAPPGEDNHVLAAGTSFTFTEGGTRHPPGPVLHPRVDAALVTIQQEPTGTVRR